MPGAWNAANPPTRAGVYFNFIAAPEAAAAAPVLGRVAVLGTADWGPLDAPQIVQNTGGFSGLYSSSTGGDLPSSVADALEGMDSGGATSVLAQRIAGAAAAAGTASVTAAVGSVTLTAKYKGARANNFVATVATNGADKDLIIYESGVEVERFLVTTGSATDLIAKINATDGTGSSLVTATAVGGPTTLTNGNYTFTGGNSGLTYTTTELQTGLDAIALYDFDAVATKIEPAASDNNLQDTIASWLLSRYKTYGKRSFLVLGGKSTDTLTGGTAGQGQSAQTRVTEYDTAGTYEVLSQDVIHLGVTNLIRLSDGVTLSTGQLAPRVAGALAAAGMRRSMVFMKLTGYKVSSALSASNYSLAPSLGVNTFSPDTVDRVKLEGGVTGLVASNNSDRPKVHKNARNVAVAHFIQNTLTRVFTDDVVGQVANTETGRRGILASVQRFLDAMAEAQALENPRVSIDDAYAQTGTALFLKVEYEYAESIERVFVTIKVR